MSSKCSEGHYKMPTTRSAFCFLSLPSNKNIGDRTMIFSEVYKTRLYSPCQFSLGARMFTNKAS